jgi:predicted O-methyltransferase YrrM
MTRCDLIIKLIKENSYKTAAEIGVRKGRMSLPIMSALDLDLYLMVDIEPKPELLEMLKGMQRKKYAFYQMDSLEAAKLIPDKSLDIIFIDADHSFLGVNNDIKAWLPKVREGGILAGHDYNHSQFPGVTNAVNECFMKGIIPAFELIKDDKGETPEVKCWWFKV